MSAIWHDHGLPSFMGAAPRWERKMGAAYYQHNAKMAWENWQRHRPWWLV